MGRLGRTIAMLNQKGGVGKTTSTVNLGAALAATSHRVLLIDLDPQAHLTLHLGIEDELIGASVYDLLIDPQCTAEQAIIAGARENLDVIAAETDLAGAETELAAVSFRQSQLVGKLRPVLDRYDVVLIDCPPSLGLLTLNALSLAKEVIVPMQAHFLALQGVSKLLETVGRVCQSVNEELRVSGIILCMHEGQTTLAREVVADLEAFFEQARDSEAEASQGVVPWRDCRVLLPAVRRNIKLAEAPSFGQTIFDYEPWCPGACDYRKLAEALMESRCEEFAHGEALPQPERSAPVSREQRQHNPLEIKIFPSTATSNPGDREQTPSNAPDGPRPGSHRKSRQSYE